MKRYRVKKNTLDLIDRTVFKYVANFWHYTHADSAYTVSTYKHMEHIKSNGQIVSTGSDRTAFMIKRPVSNSSRTR